MTSPPRQQQGFALVLVLVFIVIALTAIGFFAQRVSQARQVTAQLQQRARTSVLMHDSTNRMLYRLNTVHKTMYGIGAPPEVIRLDDRAYRDGGLTVRVMDERGLFTLRFAKRQRFERLLTQFGVPTDVQPKLIDALLDYTDEDDLRRLNGAEADDYRAAGLPAPPNAPLESVRQLRHILYWRERTELLDNPDFVQLLTTARVTGINPNAAPLPVLTTLPNVDRQTGQALVDYRDKQPLTTGIIGALTGLSANRMQFTIFPFPSRHLRLTLSCSCPHPATRYNIALTPTSDYAPWSFNGYRSASVKSPASGPSPLPALLKP